MSRSTVDVTRPQSSSHVGPITASPVKLAVEAHTPCRALDVTFDGPDNDSGAEAFLHAPSTPLLNHFATHAVRAAAHASPVTMATATTELSPIAADSLPSEAAVVDLYTQIASGQKHADAAVKPVRGTGDGMEY